MPQAKRKRQTLPTTFERFPEKFPTINKFHKAMEMYDNSMLKAGIHLALVNSGYIVKDAEVDFDKPINCEMLDVATAYVTYLLKEQGAFNDAGVTSSWINADRDVEETRLTMERREKLELENAKVKGELVSIDDAKEDIAERVTEARAIILSLITNGVKIFSAAKSVEEFEIWMREEVHRVLHSLANQHKKEEVIEDAA